MLSKQEWIHLSFPFSTAFTTIYRKYDLNYYRYNWQRFWNNICKKLFDLICVLIHLLYDMAVIACTQHHDSTAVHHTALCWPKAKHPTSENKREGLLGLEFWAWWCQSQVNLWSAYPEHPLLEIVSFLLSGCPHKLTITSAVNQQIFYRALCKSKSKNQRAQKCQYTSSNKQCDKGYGKIIHNIIFLQFAFAITWPTAVSYNLEDTRHYLKNVTLSLGL